MGQLREAGIIKQSTALPDPVPSSHLPHWLEFYSNHLGAVDNFTQIAVGGNGSANADATNHEMDLSSGTLAGAAATVNAKKSWPAPTSFPMVCIFILNNIVAGSGGQRQIMAGMRSGSWGGQFQVPGGGGERIAAFLTNYDGATWYVVTCNGGGSSTSTQISAIQNGDLLTIVITSSKVTFYVNGIAVASHTTLLPDSAMTLGVDTAIGLAATGAISCSVDLIQITRYLG